MSTITEAAMLAALKRLGEAEAQAYRLAGTPGEAAAMAAFTEAVKASAEARAKHGLALKDPVYRAGIEALARIKRQA